MEFSVGCVITMIFFIELTMTRVNRFTTVSSTLVCRAVANPTRQTALAQGEDALTCAVRPSETKCTETTATSARSRPPAPASKPGTQPKMTKMAYNKAVRAEPQHARL